MTQVLSIVDDVLDVHTAVVHDEHYHIHQMSSASNAMQALSKCLPLKLYVIVNRWTVENLKFVAFSA